MTHLSFCLPQGGSLLFRAALTSPSLQVLNLANNELTDVRALDMTKAVREREGELT